jgi:hypothetical protein
VVGLKALKKTSSGEHEFKISQVAPGGGRSVGDGRV